MAEVLRLGSTFFKAHGHGNDYLVFEEGDAWTVTPEAVRILCHRNRGVGGDGIVALLSTASPGVAPEGPDRRPPQGQTSRLEGPFRLRMFNPDGSEFERSGNGLRILGAFLRSRGVVEVGELFRVEVGGEEVELEILDVNPGEGLEVAVEMGSARFGIDAVGGKAEGFGSGNTLSDPGGSPLEVVLVSVGNPHCVLFRKELLEEEIQELGPFLTANPAFPAGVNVQLGRVVNPGEVRILIWERGVGRTASSGTSACAVAAAGVSRGHLRPGVIRVVMDGGSFRVTVSPEMRIRLEGPVQPLMTGKLRPELLDRLP